MNLYFEIYRSSKDGLYYWRLRKKEDHEIIATGHQAYYTVSYAELEIKQVISAMPTTTIVKNI